MSSDTSRFGSWFHTARVLDVISWPSRQYSTPLSSWLAHKLKCTKWPDDVESMNRLDGSNQREGTSTFFIHWFNLTRSLHDLLALPQISSCHPVMTSWFPFPCLSSTIQAIVCHNLHNSRSNSSRLLRSLTHADCPPALLAVNPQLISFFPTGTISLSVSQLPPSPSTPLISLQPPAKWIMRSISPPRPPGLFHSLRAQPASPPLLAATRLQTPPPPQHPMWRPIRFNEVAHAVHTPKKVFGFQVNSLLRSP